MKSLLRWLVGILIMLGTLLLSNCSPYGCRVTFGSSTCTSSGSTGFGGGGSGGGGGGGGGGSTAAAFVFGPAGNAGNVQEYELFPSAQTLTLNSSVLESTSGVYYSIVMAGTQNLYAINSLAGQIYGWTVASDGTLAAVNGSPFAASYLVNSPVVGQNVITNPAGTLMFVSVQSPTNEIYIYQIGSGGVLSQANGSPFLLPTGFVPGNLATDGLGKYLYVSNVVSPGDLSTEVAGYAIGSGSSVLTAVPGSPFGFPIWQMQGDPSGLYMIGTDGQAAGDSHLHVFSIQSGSTAGAIVEVMGSPFPTVNPPADVVVQPGSTNPLVYSFSLNVNDADNPIEGYQLNTSSGALTAISGSPFSFIGRNGQFDQSGQFLFAFDGLDSTLWVFNVSSSGALTSSVASSGGFLGPWVASDLP